MAALQGENQIGKFRNIVGKLVSRITTLEGVAGVVFIGGLARGYADKYSDIDILVFLDRKDKNLRRRLRQIGAEEQKRSHIDIDLEVHFLQDFSRWKWSEMSLWDFSHAKIVYDAHGKIRKSFNRKLRISRNFWVKRIVIYSEYLKWYCCPPKRGLETLVDAWVVRGDMVSAHYCVNYAFDLMLRVLFALNKEFLPPQKWRLFYSYSLNWLPKDYRKLVEETMTVKSFSKRDLDRRTQALQTMWQLTLPKIKSETGLTPKLISKCYVEKVLHQI
ncbi:nucleotidyltransferase domain-containing protein [Candidatus Bathyarchaeota archaeon]|nr:nucleotidyltransferase domain-containing protein [Candidatus Bathyarchaeota archaeon]